MKRIKSQIDYLKSEIPVSTLYYRNIKWHLDHYVDSTKPVIERHHGPLLQIGTIYTFQYDPKYKDKLSFYDNYPINLIMGHIETKDGKMNPYGINLSYIPPPIRIKILDKFIDIFEVQIDNNRKLISDISTLFNHPQKDHIPITYKVAKMVLKDSGFEYAIRSYIYSRIESDPKIITYDEWYRTCLFSSQYIKGLNLASIRYRYKKARDATYRIGQLEKEVILKDVTAGDLNLDV